MRPKLRIVKFCAAMMLSAAMAQAQTVPTLFSLVDVASDDVLNVRPTPDTSGAPIATILPDLGNIEVVALNDAGTWGQINLGEATGWVNMRYMKEQAGIWTPGGLPATLRCFGTEPFWSIRPDGPRLTLSSIDGGDVSLPISGIDDEGSVSRPGRIVTAADGAGTLTLTISNASCSDGMSDRQFGLSATAISTMDGDRVTRTGCCQIQP